MLKGAREEAMGRIRLFLDGRVIVNVLWDASQGALGAEQALLDAGTSGAAAYRNYAAWVTFIDEVQKARYDADRIAIQDYLQSRCVVLGAEIELARARAGTLPPAAELRRNMRDLAEQIWGWRMKEFLAGRESTWGVLWACKRRLEAEGALVTNHSEGRTALERSWMATRTIESHNRLRPNAGRIYMEEYLEDYHARLEAQLAWIEALRKK
jgi:hypothetical protein